MTPWKKGMDIHEIWIQACEHQYLMGILLQTISGDNSKNDRGNEGVSETIIRCILTYANSLYPSNVGSKME